MKRILSILAIFGLFFACSPDDNNLGGKDNQSNTAPSVTVGSEQISAISAVLNGKANIGKSVAYDLKVGFQYSKSAGILPSNSITIEVVDADAEYNYTASITGLEPATTYYFRSFIRQNDLDTYGVTMEFTTKDIESLLGTLEASNIEASSAQVNAKLDLTDTKYDSMSYGFCWGTSETYLNKDYRCNTYKDNTYTAILTGLSHKTQYWYKAYVQFDSQRFFGGIKSFTTDVVPVESVSLDKTEYTFNYIGDSITLKPTVLPADATNKSITWTVDNNTVATVDSTGKVTAVGNGTATITATTNDQGFKATCAIVVDQLVTGITLDNASISLSEGQEQTLIANISPDYAVDKTVTWTTSNASIAQVDDDGKVTAISEGKATITVTSNDGSGLSASCNVIVSYPCPEGAVDLGLTINGFKIYWSKYNLGENGLVSSPEEFGAYYSWGETEAKNDNYNWTNYKWCNGTYQTLTKYNSDYLFGTVVDKKTVLDADDDAARKKLGGRWRIPTVEEWTALRDSCSRVYTTHNGVYGMLFTAPNGNSIFIPAADNKGAPRWTIEDPAGNYWTTSLSAIPYLASAFYFNSKGGTNISSVERGFGLPIRPVFY